jgi:hypothetical protein
MLTKHAIGHIFGVFSQTHLVTLLVKTLMGWRSFLKKPFQLKTKTTLTTVKQLKNWVSLCLLAVQFKLND